MTLQTFETAPLSGLDLCGFGASSLGNTISHPCTVGTEFSYEFEQEMNQIIYKLSKGV